MQSIHYFCVKNVKYTDLLVEKCALMHMFFFQKRPGCVLIGACALIGINTVCLHIEMLSSGLILSGVRRHKNVTLRE